MRSRAYRKAASFVTMDSDTFRLTPAFLAELPMLEDRALDLGITPIDVMKADGSYVKLSHQEIVTLKKKIGERLQAAAATEAIGA